MIIYKKIQLDHFLKCSWQKYLIRPVVDSKNLRPRFHKTSVFSKEQVKRNLHEGRVLKYHLKRIPFFWSVNTPISHSTTQKNGPLNWLKDGLKNGKCEQTLTLFPAWVYFFVAKWYCLCCIQTSAMPSRILFRSSISFLSHVFVRSQLLDQILRYRNMLLHTKL